MRRRRQGLNSPINNEIGMVIIPVTDLQTSVAWYGNVFGVSILAPSDADTLAIVPMQENIGVMLDATKRVVSNSSQPLCFFWTPDIKATRAFLVSHDIDIVRELDGRGNMPTLVFSDPDGNLLMVCQRIALTEDQIQRVTTFLREADAGQFAEGAAIDRVYAKYGVDKNST